MKITINQKSRNVLPGDIAITANGRKILIYKTYNGNFEGVDLDTATEAAEIASTVHELLDKVEAVKALTITEILTDLIPVRLPLELPECEEPDDVGSDPKDPSTGG